MKLVNRAAILILFSFTLAVFSLDDPADNAIITCPDSIPIQSGGNAEIKVSLSIPEGNYIFIEKITDEASGIITSFSIQESSGIVITGIDKPAGERLKNEVVLSGSGTFTLFVSDKTGHSPGTEVQTAMEITIQLCNKKKGICFFPRTLKKDIVFKISDFTWSYKDYDKYTYKTFPEILKVTSRIDFENIDYLLLHAAIFYETNRHRTLHGKKEFAHSPALEKAAKGHSDDMVKKNFFDHKSPVKGKETMTKRLEQVGISGGYMAENIAYSFGIEYKSGKSVFTPDLNGGYFSYTFKGDPIKNHTYLGFAKEVVAQWMGSSGHRANILNSQLTYLGTGASHYTDTKFYEMDNFKCTQNFASVKGPAEE